MAGRYCRLEPLSVGLHAAQLYAANATDVDGRMWTYLPDGPFASIEDYSGWMSRMVRRNDRLFFAVIDAGLGQATGVAAYLRIQPDAGSIEVGQLMFSPLLQQATAATEAMYLMMANAFRLGYRRYEWKCNALNLPSRRAALRLGFQYEGIFRQAMVAKGRNRDTAWYSVIDAEWPALEAVYARWLDPANFESGRQKVRLSSLTAALRGAAVTE